MSSFSTGVFGTITTNSPVLKLPEGSLTTSPIASCIRAIGNFFLKISASLNP